MNKILTVRLQRCNRYSKSTCTEKESIANIIVNTRNGTAKYNGRIYKYIPISATKFGKLGNKKSCYYIIEVIANRGQEL